MANATTYLANKLTDHLTGTAAYTMPTLYVGVFTTAPTMPAGTGGVEPDDDAYARVELTGHMAASSSGAASNSDAIDFAEATADWGDVAPPAVGYWDAATGGNLLLVDASPTIDDPVTSGDTLSFAAGDIDVSATTGS